MALPLRGKTGQTDPKMISEMVTKSAFPASQLGLKYPAPRLTSPTPKRHKVFISYFVLLHSRAFGSTANQRI